MQKIIKNHFAFALALIVSTISTLVSIIGMEQVVGLHELFGRGGAVELIVFGFIFTGVVVFLTSQYLYKMELIQQNITWKHLHSVGLFYPVIVLIIFLVYHKEGAGDLQETYLFTFLFCAIVTVITNYGSLVYMHKKNTESN